MGKPNTQLMVTDADRERLLRAQEDYRQGTPLALIESKYSFGEAELSALTTTVAWREVAVEREEMRRARLMDRVMDMGEATIAISQRVSRRVDDIARTANEAGEVKDLASALKDLSSAAKNTAEAIGGVRESAGLGISGNVIQTLQIMSRPNPAPPQE